MWRIDRGPNAHPEAGAVAVFVAILMVVLLGFAALAVDVGALYWEHRQLQNGADAGSLAVAQDVAQGIAGGTVPTPEDFDGVHTDTAKEYADANAADGSADVETVTLDPIDGISLDRAGEITVTTLVNDGGTNELSHWFAPVPVIGISSSAVRASASAIYGPLGQVVGAFPVVICESDYDNNGEVFETVLKRPPGQGGEVQTDCPTDPDSFPPGQTPGNFSWLTPSGDACDVDFDLSEGETTDEASGDTGVNAPQGCGDEARVIADGIAAYKAGSTDQLPIRHVAVFSSVDGTGSGTVYQITKLAAFEFHGIKTVAPGGPNPNAVVGSWSSDCSGSSTHCIKGRFTQDMAMGVIDLDADSDLLGVQLTR